MGRGIVCLNLHFNFKAQNADNKTYVYITQKKKKKKKKKKMIFQAKLFSEFKHCLSRLPD